MPSPFPGMDPYIESQRRFHSFHTAFIAACSDAINDRLPTPYFATVAERVLVDVTDPDDPLTRTVMHDVEPDVAVVGGDAPPPFAHTGTVATLVPSTLPQAIVTLDQPTQKFIEVHGPPDERLITTVELMSRSNKRPGADRDAFLLKRADLLRHGVNLVDIDLLLAGRRIPLLGTLPPGQFFAMVIRADTAEQCDAYGWTAREQLPTIPVPLESEGSEVPLDLGAVFEGVYRRSHYERMLRYDKPLLGPWSDADRAWIAEQLAARDH